MDTTDQHDRTRRSAVGRGRPDHRPGRRLGVRPAGVVVPGDVPGQAPAATRWPPRAGRLTRRGLLTSAGAVGLGALAGCGIPPARTTQGADATQDRSARDKTVTFANWPLYIDMSDDEEHRPTLEAFQRRTGIKVTYTQEINDNDEFFGKIKPQLAAGQETGRDLIVVTDWMAARMIRLGWVQKLDQANLPHAYANLDQRFRFPDWDPGRAHSYPWAGISTVVAYNRRAVRGEPVTGVGDLLDNPAFKGRVAMLTEMRDTIGMTMLAMGIAPEEFTADEYDATLARIQKAVDKGQIRRFTGNDYGPDLDKGDLAACIAWAGDLIQLQADNPDIAFVVPDHGYLSSTDNLLIPNKARHKHNAEALIDWYYQPKIAAELAAWVNYISPVAGVFEELKRIDEATARDPLIVPDQKMAAKSHTFRALRPEEEREFESKFARLIGA